MAQKVYENIEELKQTISHLNINSVFLVRGKGSFTACGGDKFIEKVFKGKQIISFSDFEPNPKQNDLINGIKLFNKQPADIIVALGGGSVLDMAKLISTYVHQIADYTEITKGKVKLQGSKTPLIAIPTTAGTGAEATPFAVLYIDKIKYSVASPLLLPDYVFLSADFTMAANKYLTACTGADAFCQALESMWSVNANNESIDYATKALNLIWENLPLSVNLEKYEARQEMLYAAYLAGKAINITRTTAPHAISYAFTSYYGIPHGHAVALSIPFFLSFNYAVNASNCTDPLGANEVKKRIDRFLSLIDCSIDEAHKKLIDFFNKVNISLNINELVKKLDDHLIIDNVNTERLNNNPRKVSKQDVKNFLESIK